MEPQVIFNNIKEKIIENLNQAKFSIYIAVPWLTDKDIKDIILKRAGENISIEIIMLKDDINFEDKEFISSMEQYNSKLYIYNSSSNLMHNKFCVIDNKILITGSYNWTYGAQKNYENLQIYSGHYEITEMYLIEFTKIKKECISAQNAFANISKPNYTKPIIEELIDAFPNYFQALILKYYPLKLNFIKQHFKSKSYRNQYYNVCENKSINWDENYLDYLYSQDTGINDWIKLVENNAIDWKPNYISKYYDKLSEHQNLGYGDSMRVMARFGKNSNIIWSQLLVQKLKGEFWEMDRRGFQYFPEKYRYWNKDKINHHLSEIQKEISNYKIIKKKNEYTFDGQLSLIQLKLIDLYKNSYWPQDSFDLFFSLLLEIINGIDLERSIKFNLSSMNIPISPAQIDKVVEHWNWDKLVLNKNINWNYDLIKKYEKMFTDKTWENLSLCHVKLSKNEFIELYDRISNNLVLVIHNWEIPIDESLFEKYFNIFDNQKMQQLSKSMLGSKYVLWNINLFNKVLNFYFQELPKREEDIPDIIYISSYKPYSSNLWIFINSHFKFNDENIDDTFLKSIN
ncbi:MAG: phospholipase D-like domain-containing protein [Bacteroidota bacterium]